MKFSPVEEYGLRCLLQLARQAGAGTVNIRAIAEAEGLSIAYVAKLMALLQKGGLVKAQRGVQGGYALAKNADQVTMDEVVRALVPGDEEAMCEHFTGQLDACVRSGQGACAVRGMWAGLTALMHDYLKDITLSRLLGDATAQKEAR